MEDLLKIKNRNDDNNNNNNNSVWLMNAFRGRGQRPMRVSANHG